ncbi:MAG: cyclophilin-like fold protein [Chloroflexota bacterium]|nr:cyclophilin-like fold protein [Chloroflexota bacterium]
MTRIRLEVDGRKLEAELNDTDTAQVVLAAIPLEARVNVWGDEIYFGIPVALDESATAQAEVAVGALGYWPPGNAFCIFYGPTPVSPGAAPRAYSPVNVFGQIDGDATVLRGVRNGALIRVERIES